MRPAIRYPTLAVILAVVLQVQSYGVATALTLAFWVILGGHRTLYLIYHTLDRDLRTAYRFVHLLRVNLKAKWRDQTVGDLFLKTAARVPEKTMMVLCHDNGEDKMTFRECRELACQVARYFQKQGYKKGDVVGLVMENRIDYCCYWIGLSMIGVIPALINSNLRQQSLLHTLTVAKCKAVLFSAELCQAIDEIRPKLPPAMDQFSVDAQSIEGAVNLREFLSDMSKEPLKEKVAGYNDPLIYIYTSGTTGLPKAAILKHSRFMFAVYALFCMTGLFESDNIYSPLPMYHTAAGAMVTGNAMCEGPTMVTRKKFSASQFWKDCAQQKVTCAQYIGEIARYLYATPESPYEKQHSIRMMFGNGLRPQIWQQFVDRFKIGQICEFYGSTEGNCSVGNFSNKVGAVGFISVLFPFLLPLGIVKVDEDTGEPLRGSDGLAIPCAYGEAGELVGRIDRGHPVRDYHGYADDSSTNKKIMKDVWNKGDMCFRSGDILVMDELGWLYFKDRAGDTFRWKGENVSTMEVEATISQVIGLRDCVVYGVEVPGAEGRAGMAAIPDPERKVDVSKMYNGMVDKLPSYARPIFLRFVDEIDLTATFKLKKRDLQKEGFNPELVKDKLFMMDSKSRTYLPLTKEMYNNIVNGNTRF